jgi:DNA-binding HxlR family transcriptional regulator
VAGYGQFCAVARALEVLGERWTLLVVRELLLGSTTFTQVSRGLPRIPRATLSDRLAKLSAAGLVETSTGGYLLTKSGKALSAVMEELARWATDADAASLHPDHLDTAALTWDIQRRVDRNSLPDRLVVIEIAFADRPASDRRFWLHLSPSRVDLCRQDTGAPIDLWLSAPVEPVTRWWLGQLSWSDLASRSDVTIRGDRSLQRQLPTWFQRYLYTPAYLGREPD